MFVHFICFRLQSFGNVVQELSTECQIVNLRGTLMTVKLAGGLVGC